MAELLDVTEKKAHILKANKKLVDWLLTMNVNNRHVKKSHLAWISDSITRGEFILTGQGISISSTGKLIDGQHRLMAIREAGYPAVDLMVVTGLDDKARVYVDQNAKRSTADMLKIVLNKSISTKMAAVINFHIRMNEIKGDFIYGRNKPSLDTIVDQMTEYSELLSIIIDAAGSRGRAGTICGYLHYALKYNEDRAIEIASMVNSGENLSKGDPAYQLREYLLKGNHGWGSAGQIEDYKYTATACIADALNVEIKSFRPSSSWRELPPKLGRYLVKDKQ